MEFKNVKIKQNKFSVNEKMYIIDNPKYLYKKSSVLGIKFYRKLLVYKENVPASLNLSKNSSMVNQINAEILNKLYYAKVVQDAFSNKNEINYFVFMILILVAFVIGFLGGKF